MPPEDTYRHTNIHTNIHTNRGRGAQYSHSFPTVTHMNQSNLRTRFFCALQSQGTAPAVRGVLTGADSNDISCPAPFPHFIQSRTPAHGTLPPSFRLGLTTSNNLVRKSLTSSPTPAHKAPSLGDSRSWETIHTGHHSFSGRKCPC